MGVLNDLRSLTRDQRNAFLAAYLGWTLDAFDYFLLVFVIKDVAQEFHTARTSVAVAVMLTLAFRPVGALLFGIAGDKFGRRTPLMIDVILYAALELLSGFAPNLTVFLILRALFGIGMGGEWGLGASLALESAPARLRGLLSGILQQGYPVGYLLGAILYPMIVPSHGWRWLFIVGAAPALLSIFIRAKVKESPAWLEGRHERPQWNLGSLVKQNCRLFGSLTILMAAFNFMSHGTQDSYPTFLQVQHHFDPKTVGHIAQIYNVGALIGGIFFGALSQRIGRRKSIAIAALLGLPMIPLWAFSHTAATLAFGAFLMQFCVQGAWGVVPAHLTELSPSSLRGTFTGFAYQMGNLIASVNLPLQTWLADRPGGTYSLAMAEVTACALIAVAVVTSLGQEARGADLRASSPAP